MTSDHSATNSAPSNPAWFLNPTGECDLVMKGGVTSGIVYPPAVITLARKYRFRNIGGTSAGAIASAVTAAAEYGRETPKGGFGALDSYSRWLGEDRNLLNLFQPSPETAGLMDSALEITDAARDGRLRSPGGARASSSRPRRHGVMSGGRALQERARAIGHAMQTIAEIMQRHNPAPTQRGRRRYGMRAVYGATLIFGALGLISLALLALVALISDWSVRVGQGLVLVLVMTALVGVVAFIVGRWAGALIGVAGHLMRVMTSTIPANFYGMCRGREEPTRSNAAALTDWLYQRLNELAGLNPNGPPLTFRQLAEKQVTRRTDGGEEIVEPCGITLRMVTTNLSHGQPYVLPLVDKRFNALFIFKRSEMEQLFPEPVIEYLCDPARAVTQLPLPADFFILPAGLDLPVIVAMRLSLSFPVLLSAVKLYTIAYPALQEFRRRQRAGELAGYEFDPARDLQANWFSDGGIVSNFPIHFFDDWLPSRPTFGIKLTSFPRRAFEDDSSDSPLEPEYVSGTPSPEQTTPPEPEAPAGTGTEPERQTPPVDPIFLPRANAPLAPDWTPIHGLLEFGHSVWTAAQNYRDNTQGALPSYRERVVQIRLADFEGGLNLAMAPNVIHGMVAKGRDAGDRLLAFNFDHHRWVRFLVLMAQLERQLHEFCDDWNDNEYAALLHKIAAARSAASPADAQASDVATAGSTSTAPYARSGVWITEATRRVEALLRVATQWEQADRDWFSEHRPPDDELPGKPARFFGHNPPQPEPVLRVTPDL